MSSRFSYRIVVQKDDIDQLGHVNNVVFVRWVQEVAAAHWDTVAPIELRKKYSWVVLRHEIDYRSPAFLNDVVIGETWVGEHHGARFERFVTLKLEKDNKLLVEAKTMWCMLEGQTMRPVRITKDVLELL